ncbi:ribonuclease PH [Kamptonema cortianum]|nr:ribonuclease PH [Oscillatoria laete-virens]MDK3157939.1 ribonuclease PH [Kamptonema cortianum]MDL5046066.1 ribonuclease PH [Oscillatoria amoena NRMC-F 0135]MDL5052773.1 ribonuclease PH [Oscillatoria laete-virens NRMC-F 0139]
MPRPDSRAASQLRPLTITQGIAPHATGSVLIGFGNTRVICAVTVEESVPRWMKEQGVTGGWVTAEYSMLPYSTLGRKPRDISKGKIDGRSQEIQRLVGRSLRAVIDLEKLGSRTLWIDCDVLQADGGTRTASITGAMIALALAVEKLKTAGKITDSPIKQFVSAISVGIYDGQPVLDLNYIEDSKASVDMNVVMTEKGEFVEIQGSGEEATFTEAQMAQMLALAKKGIAELISFQKSVIA